MYGTDQKTGKQIRLLQHSTSTWKDKKTLVWLDSTINIDTETNRWNRYEIGCVGAETFETLVTKQLVPDVIICLETKDVQWIFNEGYNKCKLIFAAKQVLDIIGLPFFEENKIANILCLEELPLLYTFIDKPWDLSINDACILVALVLRFGYTFPLEHETVNRNLFNLHVTNVLEAPQQLYYITQYYESKQARRGKEIDYCLKRNVENSYIDHIVLLNEEEHVLPIHSQKIKQIVINKRLYYDDVIKYIHDTIPENSIVVFANADIYLDTTIRSIWSTNIDDKFFALLRYDDDLNGGYEIFGPRADSQDTWIISSNSVKQRSKLWKYNDIHISFGMSGCDNAITLEMLRMKFLIVNPSLSIITHHVHNSEIRTYEKEDIVDKNIYLYIEPTGLHDMEAVVQIPSANIDTKLSLASFDRPILCNNQNKANTFCAMVQKEKRYVFSASGKNNVPAVQQPIYKFDKIFQTNTGLLYGYDKIYVGQSKIATEYWSKSNLSTLSPSIKIKKGYVAPLPSNVSSSVENYLLYYFGKILMMREKYGADGEFWAPNKKEFIETLTQFDWKTKNVPIISSTNNNLGYLDTAYVWFPSDNLEVSMEEMNALRNFVKKYTSPEEDCVAVYMDNEYVNKQFIKELESIVGNVKIIFPQTTVERKLSILQNASTFITACSQATSNVWKYIWAMKPSSRLIDIHYEMEISGEVHHIVSACGLQHVLHLVPKGPMSSSLQTKVLESVNILKQKQVVPSIYVPTPNVEGFFHHKGDSFREIIDIWAERGYIKKEYADCKNVWLNAIGDTLLYDRPTHDWLKQSESYEQTWKKALFGNPKPIGPNSTSWSFWPRRPRLVEGLVAKGDFKKTKGIVFYGCTENAIQEKYRTKYDWSTCCDEFVLLQEPKFSEQEYLENISKASYGLCLAGFGKKCHREVECMAFGTVPLCASEVDMDSYANPPQEGIHYIRVSSPEELVRKVALISEAQWLQLSEACKKWYLQNSSVDGMWKLTKNIS